jgi:chemotaxis family two-component system sensor kinase Cph1
MNQAAIPLVIDLSTCAREPIRTPGSIQPHGFLLTLSEDWKCCRPAPTWRLDRHGRRGRARRPLAESSAPAALQRWRRNCRRQAGPAPLLPRHLHARPAAFDVLGHRWDQLVIVEFELVERAEAADFRHLYPLIGDFLLNGERSRRHREALAQLACERVRAVTGFGRVLVYQFDSDGHGHVMAESKEDSYHSYMGQHFPASDIPAQARELYALSRIRLIQDANYTPAPLVPAENPLTGKPNDLSFAALRSVSPVHLQYMRNMRTLASMSVSLMVKGKLWGLISCHNEGPAPSFEKRTACEQLARSWRCRIEIARGRRAELQFRLDMRRIMVSMLAGLTQGSDFIENLSSVFPELLRFARAGGVAIVVDERVLTYGDTPDEAIEVRWSTGSTVHDHGETSSSTDKLSAAYPEGAADPQRQRPAGDADLAHPQALPAVVPSRVRAHHRMGRQSARQGRS